MSLLVVGTVAMDTIETAHGTAERVLGGSATFFATAASNFTRPRLVAVVGEDFPAEYRRYLESRNIDTAGLYTQPGGKTFYWHGRYHPDMNGRDTLEVQLNVLETFDPVLPASYRDSTHVFLANINPSVQLKVLDQIERPQFVMADTMDFWIATQHEALLKLMTRLDGISLNDSEAEMLTGTRNMVTAGEKIRKMGPKFVIIKRGEHGAMLSTHDGVFTIPAYPTEKVVDPTGAGDTFAGGLMGHLASEPEHSIGRLRRSMAYGTVTASLTVEGFGVERIKDVTIRDIEDRLYRYRSMLDFWSNP